MIEKEIEIKFKADDAVLTSLKGIEMKSYEEEDEYFTTKEMLENSTFLRFRKKHGKTILIMKDITNAKKEIYEADEIQIELNDENYRKLREIFSRLLPFSFIVRKIRSKGFMNGCELCLDKVDGLGDFLEIEGKKENIEQVCKKLKLDLKNTDKERGYAHMMVKKLKMVDYKIRDDVKK